MISNIVELYENQRYAFSGWSASSLLPTDRYTYSSKDGVDGWSTITEAETAQLSKGWNWILGSEWMPEISDKTDESGWMYAVNFGSIDDAKPVKAMVHFVRRRRLVRERVFDVSDLVDMGKLSSCYCDSMEIEKLSLQIAHIIGTASLLRYPSRISLTKLNIIKNEFITFISLDEPHTLVTRITTTAGSPKSSTTTTTTTTTTTATGGSLKNYNQLSTMDRIKSYFSTFPTANQTVFSAMNASLSSEINQEGLTKRIQEISQNYLTSIECIELAKLIIKIYDFEYYYHCNHIEREKNNNNNSISEKCNDKNCQYVIVSCPNKDCTIHISNKWLSLHDETCPYKIISCQRECGVCVVRRMMTHHMNTVCDLKPVPCPFYDIGCIADLVQINLPKHIDTCMSSHLLLTMSHIQEQQRTIQDLTSKLKHMEDQHTQGMIVVTTVQTGITALTTTIEQGHQKHLKHLDEEIKKLDTKYIKSYKELASSQATENNNMKKSITALETQTKELKINMTKVMNYMKTNPGGTTNTSGNTSNSSADSNVANTGGATPK